MMNKLHVLLVAMLLLSGYNAEAQSASIPNVLKLRNIKQKGPIFENEELLGYFVFYFKENNDNKTKTHVVEIFDDNYNPVNSFEITRPHNNHLMEIVYNGEAFMLFFYDVSFGYVFLTYNKNGEEIGSHKIPKKDIPDFDLRSTILSKPDTQYEILTISPIENSGFIRQSTTKNVKRGYELVAFDNALNVIWTLKSDAQLKLVQFIEITDISEEIIAVTIFKKKSILSTKGDREFILLDASTGELIKKVDMGNKEDGDNMVLKTFFDKKEEKIVLIGEYFKPGDNYVKDKSKGLFIKEISEEGENISIKKYAWKGEIDQFYNTDNLTKKEKKDHKAAFSICFHNVIRSENGHLFLIGEQFSKRFEGSEGPSSAYVEIKSPNLTVIELDGENDLKGYKVIKKKEISFSIPAGYIGQSNAIIGKYINRKRNFDYQFTSSDIEKDEFTVIYKDYDRKEGIGAEKSEVMIGVLHIKAGKLETQLIPFNKEVGKFWFMPAKSGYISIMEYFRKENKFDMRLEKVIY